MAFEVFKMGKLSDHLESEAYGWVAHWIKQEYGLEVTENEYGYEQDVVEVMTEEHVKEIEQFLNDTLTEKLWIEPYANTALNSICDRWRDENDKW
jgi:phage-related protein